MLLQINNELITQMAERLFEGVGRHIPAEGFQRLSLLADRFAVGAGTDDKGGSAPLTRTPDNGDSGLRPSTHATRGRARPRRSANLGRRYRWSSKDAHESPTPVPLQERRNEIATNWVKRP